MCMKAKAGKLQLNFTAVLFDAYMGYTASTTKSMQPGM